MKHRERQVKAGSRQLATGSKKTFCLLLTACCLLVFLSACNNDFVQKERGYFKIDFPQFEGRLHLSYKEIGKHKFDSLVNDAFTMSYKQHTTRASAIQSQPFTTPNGISGVYFTLKGNAATANQFFATDSVKHFLRGALYFNATPNEDSLRPVNNFLREDMQHLINTLRWK